MNKKRKKSVSSKCDILKLVFNYGKVNCLSLQVLKSIQKLLIKFDKHSYVRGLILTSNFSNFLQSKRHVFCAGLDLRGIEQFKNKNDFEGLKNYILQMFETFDLFNKMSKPIVCGINGDAIAGGCMTALNCDFRIMSSNGRIGMNESEFGVSMSYPSLNCLVNVTGNKNASFIAQTGLYFVLFNYVNCNSIILARRFFFVLLCLVFFFLILVFGFWFCVCAQVYCLTVRML